MIETPLPIQPVLVMADQFSLLFQQVQNLTIAIQTVQTILAPLRMMPQPTQATPTPPSVVQLVALSTVPSVVSMMVPPSNPIPHSASQPPLQLELHVPPQSLERRHIS